MISRIVLKSKIHGAKVTEANLQYEGSITIDKNLIKAANLLPYEQVQVLDVENGARFETYVIVAEPDSGTICVNGPAARLVHIGDTLLILSYSLVAEEEARSWQPLLIRVDSNNRIIK